MNKPNNAIGALAAAAFVLGAIVAYAIGVGFGWWPR